MNFTGSLICFYFIFQISPYMNRVLRGKVTQTYVRGQLVYADNELIGQPKGKMLLNES